MEVSRAKTGKQALLVSVEDRIIQAVTRNGDEQFRRQSRTGNTSERCPLAKLRLSQWRDAKLELDQRFGRTRRLGPSGVLTWDGWTLSGMIRRTNPPVHDEFGGAARLLSLDPDPPQADPELAATNPQRSQSAADLARDFCRTHAFFHKCLDLSKCRLGQNGWSRHDSRLPALWRRRTPRPLTCFLEELQRCQRRGLTLAKARALVKAVDSMIDVRIIGCRIFKYTTISECSTE